MKYMYISFVIFVILVIGYMTSFHSYSQESVRRHLPILAEKPEKRVISLNFVGDILAARSIETTMRKTSYDYPFAKITHDLADADITFANLETPLIGTATSGKTTIGGSTVFRGDVAFAQALKRAGIDIVSIANNHMKDQGERGILSTVSALDNAGVAHVGAGKNVEDARALTMLETQGVKVGYLAYNDSDVIPPSYHATDVQSGTNIMNTERLREDIERARSKVDVLIVSMHSGTEYITAHPNSHQTEFAHAAIDAGADMVIGHHPHVLEPLEIYKGKYVFYSLGNFVFDQPWPDTKESALVHMIITLSASTTSVGKTWNIDTYKPTIIPLTIQNFQPQKVDSTDKATSILNRFSRQQGFFSIAGQNIYVELATTSSDRTIGLSFRKELPKETGLLFVFDAPGRPGLWMKDMFFPIDMYWFDRDFKLVDKELYVSPITYPHVFYPKADAVYVLETSAGLLDTMSLTDTLTGELTYIQSYDKR